VKWQQIYERRSVIGSQCLDETIEEQRKDVPLLVHSTHCSIGLEYEMKRRIGGWEFTLLPDEGHQRRLNFTTSARLKHLSVLTRIKKIKLVSACLLMATELLYLNFRKFADERVSWQSQNIHV
jgi:hypothetical protein